MEVLSKADVHKDCNSLCCLERWSAENHKIIKKNLRKKKSHCSVQFFFVGVECWSSWRIPSGKMCMSNAKGCIALLCLPLKNKQTKQKNPNTQKTHNLFKWPTCHILTATLWCSHLQNSWTQPSSYFNQPLLIKKPFSLFFFFFLGSSASLFHVCTLHKGCWARSILPLPVFTEHF